MKATSTSSKIKSMRLSNDIIDKIEKMAQRENRNFTNMVETILKNATNNAVTM